MESKDSSYQHLPSMDSIDDEERIGFLNGFPLVRHVRTRSMYGLLASRTINEVTDDQCIRHMSAYSPLIEQGVVKMHWVNYDALFRTPSIYKGGPERDDAWEALFNVYDIDIPENKLSELNKDESVERLRSPVEFGGGIAGLVEYQHQLHCLNNLRQWTYLEDYRNPEGELPERFIGSGNLVRMHLDHCIEILRLNILCIGDVTPILYTINNGSLGYEADFNTLHKCRNTDAIGAWVDEHRLPYD